VTTSIRLHQPEPVQIHSASAFKGLVETILEQRRQPEDRYEIAAMLESLGWNDERAQAVFGAEDVFALADSIWEEIRGRVVYAPFEPQERQNLMNKALDIVRSFLRGLIFALPMAISIIAMLTLRFSLWSYDRLSVEIATCIAIGTILSFLTVGGFTQSIARRGFFYLFQNHFNMARRTTFIFIRFGFLACAIVSLALFVGNVTFNLIPGDMFLIIVMYYFFLNSIWLSVTVMYMLRKELTFTGLLAFGIGIVYVLFRLLNIPIIQAQLIAVSIVSVVGMAFAYYFFKNAEKREDKGISPKLPRMSLTVYSVKPYFVYGLLYFAFLYTDRVMAWSTDHAWDPMQQYMPFFIWFRGPYELGMDFSLLVLMIPLGVSEVLVSKMMRDLEKSQKQFLGTETHRLNRLYKAIYVKMLISIAAASIVSAALVCVGLVYFGHLYTDVAGEALISNPTTWFVFGVSITAYALLPAGLMNAIVFFSLSQPGFVNRALAPALAVNVLIGFLLTRWFDDDWAVFGLLIGSILFVALTTASMFRMLKNLDYYIYAAS